MMTQPLTNQQTSQQNTCANCPQFQDYQDSRSRGLCQAFDQVTRKHHRRTPDCDHAIEQLNLPKTFKVELISEEIEADDNGYPIPVDYQIVEVTVTDSNPSSIMQAVSAKLSASGNENLKDYRVVSFWQPTLISEF